MSYQAELDEILTQLQYGTTMSDNTEPMLSNNRIIAVKAITALNAEAIGKDDPDPPSMTRLVSRRNVFRADLRQRFGIGGKT